MTSGSTDIHTLTTLPADRHAETRSNFAFFDRSGRRVDVGKVAAYSSVGLDIPHVIAESGHNDHCILEQGHSRTFMLFMHLERSTPIELSAAGIHRSYDMRYGQIIWIPPNVEYSVYGVNPSSYIGLAFERRFFDELPIETRHFRFSQHVPDYEIEDARLRHVMGAVRSELEHESPLSTMILQSLFTTAAALLLEPQGFGPADRPKRHFAPDRRLQRVVDYIDANLGSELSIDELSAVAGMSRFYFARMFREQTGDTPRTFVMSRRIARATTLLASTDLSIGEIALGLGFADHSHFTRAFRARLGVSPSEYRDERTGRSFAMAAG